tara:strand:- start:84 stop:575 length:492 start_codon:yes stop_codon:yes gene_type:complete
MNEEEKIRMASLLKLEGQGNYADNERNIGVTIPLGDGNSINLSAQDLKENNTRQLAEMLLEENYKRKQRNMDIQLGNLGLGFTGLSQKGDYSVEGNDFSQAGSFNLPYQKQYRASYDIPINDNLNLSLYGQHGDIGLSEMYSDPMQDPEKKENLIKAKLRYRF